MRDRTTDTLFKKSSKKLLHIKIFQLVWLPDHLRLVRSNLIDCILGRCLIRADECAMMGDQPSSTYRYERLTISWVLLLFVYFSHTQYLYVWCQWFFLKWISYLNKLKQGFAEPWKSKFVLVMSWIVTYSMLLDVGIHQLVALFWFVTHRRKSLNPFDRDV